MARTNIELDDHLVAEVIRRFGVSTKRDAVHLALLRLVGDPVDTEFLLALEGSGWGEPGLELDELRADPVPLL